MYNEYIDKEIARRLFAALILEKEYTGGDGLPPCVICSVMIDGYFHSRFTAENQKKAIEIFNNNEWRF